MIRSIFVKLVIVPVVVMALYNSGIINKSYATENNLKKEYEITLNDESKFLEEIYKTETDTLKIKNVEKIISDKSYTEKEIVETKTLDKSGDQYIRNQFGETKDFNDGEYRGTLSISNISVQNINNGYYEKIDEKVLSFNNYSDNDLNNIDKEITLNDTKYYLINVEWEAESTKNIDNTDVPTTYKGKKIYQRVMQVKNPDTYKVTVKYSGKVEKINIIYDYTVNYEEKELPKKEENIVIEEKEESKVNPVVIVSGMGILAVLMCVINGKNTYIYAKNSNGFKLIKTEKISDKNISIDITNCKKSNENIYAIKINPLTFKKFKGRTISIVQGNKKKDIVLWNNYYEIKL